MRIFISLLAALACCLPLCAQLPLCPMDTLVSGIHYVDTLACDTAECLEWPCGTESKCHYWQVPAYFEGVLYIGGNPNDNYNIKIITHSDSVRLDTCATLVDFAGGELQMFWKFGPDAQIVVAGPENAVIFIVVKPDTTQPHRDLPPAIARVDTMCNITAVVDPWPVPGDGLWHEAFPPYRVVENPLKGRLYVRDRRRVVVW